MGIVDRIILSIYTLLLAGLSLGVILLSLRLVSLEQVGTCISYIYGQWPAALAGGVFFLVSIRLMLAGMRSKHAKDTIIHNNELGDVHISVAAVENLVEKVARHVRGVREIKVKVALNGASINVKIRAVISPESHVPAVSSEIQQRVHDYIKNTVGVELANVEIRVDNISNDFKVKQRVE